MLSLGIIQSPQMDSQVRVKSGRDHASTSREFPGIQPRNIVLGHLEEDWMRMYLNCQKLGSVPPKRASLVKWPIISPVGRTVSDQELLVVKRDELQMPAFTYRNARGQTEWPGSQLCQQGTRASWVASCVGASPEAPAPRDAQ